MLAVFDLDGTLIDSAETMRRCWSSVQEHTGVTHIPFESYFSNIGRPFEEILSIIGFPENLSYSAKSAYFKRSLEESGQTPLFPGVYEMLVDLHQRGIKLGIITSKARNPTESILTNHGLLPLFSVVKCPDGIMSWKPHPAPLLECMALMNEEPLTTVYVGDMDVDHRCAQRAGVMYLHASYGYQPEYRVPYHMSRSGSFDYGIAFFRTVQDLHLDLKNRVMTS